MGCDLHLFVEYRKSKQESPRWESFGGHFRPERCYDIFERLAGVRGNPRNAIVVPRGFPEGASPDAQDENYIYIDYSRRPHSECPPEKAAEWVSKGKSWYDGAEYRTVMAVSPAGEIEPRVDTISRPTRVSSPDWHSHSWLTVEEFEKAVIGADIDPTIQPTDQYFGIISAMRALESRGLEVRVVFWFDN